MNINELIKENERLNKENAYLKSLLRLNNIKYDDLNTEVIDLTKSYSDALKLLDDYDHQCVSKIEGNKSEYILSYEECRSFINDMRFSKDSSVFGLEKQQGQLEGILSCINQTAFGEEIYTSLEEKAANLLYFIILYKLTPRK